ncbi:MAG: hypothetical protein ACTS6G_05260 [Candidatus Hodgkinia cicadicola]
MPKLRVNLNKAAGGCKVRETCQPVVRSTLFNPKRAQHSLNLRAWLAPSAEGTFNERQTRRLTSLMKLTSNNLFEMLTKSSGIPRKCKQETNRTFVHFR